LEEDGEDDALAAAGGGAPLLNFFLFLLWLSVALAEFQELLFSCLLLLEGFFCLSSFLDVLDFFVLCFLCSVAIVDIYKCVMATRWILSRDGIQKRTASYHSFQ